MFQKSFNKFNMSRCVFFFFVLQFIYVPPALTQSEELPCVICAYIGTVGNVKYTFDVAKVPERCDAVWYSDYFLDECMANADLNAIKSLKSANKKVYVSVTYKSYTSNIWPDIITSDNKSSYDKYVPQLETFIKDNHIDGILMEHLNLFNASIPEYACKMNVFVSKLKEDIPTLKVGLYLGFGYVDNPKVFDFSITTSVDYYVIDMNNAGSGCIASDKPRFPLTTNDSSVVSVDYICKLVEASSMKKEKRMVNVINAVMGVRPNGSQDFFSYSEKCKGTGSTYSTVCSDSIDAVYELAKFVKPHFNSMMISYLDCDDYDESCGCNKDFPVTNAFIDGWTLKPIQCCDGIAGI